MKHEQPHMSKSMDQLAHVFLYFGFIIGAYAIYIWRFDAKVQFTLILSLIIFYLVWGGLYHSYKGDLSKKIAIEYFLIAVISLLSSLFVLIS